MADKDGVCWDCIKHRHLICTGKDDPPPVGSGGLCVCTHECLKEDLEEELDSEGGLTQSFEANSN